MSDLCGANNLMEGATHYYYGQHRTEYRFRMLTFATFPHFVSIKRCNLMFFEGEREISTFLLPMHRVLPLP